MKCCKQSLIGDSGESSKDCNADRNSDSKGYAQEVSGQKIPVLVVLEDMCVAL